MLKYFCLFQKNVLRFRWAITEAVKHWRNENLSSSEKVKYLSSDILNSPSHILGEHKSCREYFCTKEFVPETSLITDFKLTGKNNIYNNLLIGYHKY